MKQRVKQLAITERSVKMKKIVAVVIIMFIFSIIILGEGSKLVFQKICERRETAWPDLGTADDEQYEWLTEAYKIKRKNNEKIVILASDGTKMNITVRQSRQSGVAWATCPDQRSHLFIVTRPEQDPSHILLSWKGLSMDRCSQCWFYMNRKKCDPW